MVILLINISLKKNKELNLRAYVNILDQQGYK